MSSSRKAENIEELAAGQRLPEREFPVGRSDLVRYAGASGDFNPLHYDDSAAQRAGMSGPIAHGMYSAGCLATALTEIVGADSLTRLAVRFRGQARLGTTLTSGIIVRAVHREGRSLLAEFDCDLVDGDGTVIVSGSATAVTPPWSQKPAEVDAAAPVPAVNGLAGTRLAPAVVVVERGPTQAFATAVKDDNPVYRSVTAATAAGLNGIPVPPTFLFAVANFGTFAEQQPTAPPGSATLVDLIAALRGGRKGAVLHGEQSFTYWAPVRVGDVLHVEGFVEAVKEKASGDGRAGLPGMTVMEVRTDYRNEQGRLLTTARSSYLFRPAPTKPGALSARW